MDQSEGTLHSEAMEQAGHAEEASSPIFSQITGKK